jgi:hypothetical protein
MNRISATMLAVATICLAAALAARAAASSVGGPLDARQLVTATGGGCAGLCDTLACSNSACSGGSKTVGSGDYYVCNHRLDPNIRCILGEPEDCYTSYWNCTPGSNCTEGCTFTVFRKPRSCSDD